MTFPTQAAGAGSGGDGTAPAFVIGVGIAEEQVWAFGTIQPEHWHALVSTMVVTVFGEQVVVVVTSTVPVQQLPDGLM
jgi:hypothetical protein